ncbi:hypothetical protein ACFQI3_06995 [Hansschlegelia quercus]|uniref:Uncharacterized protein n=1 Tax=Hansschlegelia quercus TaxID=2528245 RepID=A0A4Q9GPZ7_9HYPH|nr:hypothetical protein [Hansschlegelia quercus]TBN53707.1 hypothetical protein EYR15_07845 [Hansschlegelia quercus]
MTIICSESRARDLIGSITPDQLIEVARVEDERQPLVRAKELQVAATSAPSLSRPEWMNAFADYERTERRRQLTWNLIVFAPFILIPLFALAALI